jgi:DNA-binding transcriptional regulator YiaG
MPNIASLLKEEIARISRKQSRSETEQLKKASAHYRSEIAQLKRRIQALEQQIKRLGKSTGRGGGSSAAAAATTTEESGKQIRYSAKSLASQRRRLGLSAASFAKLLGVSALSVYKWESGNTRPRQKQIEAIAALRTMGRREAQKRLEELS